MVSGVAVPTPRTHAWPGLITPPFSAAMASSVSPRMRVWSRPMPVTQVTRGCVAVVASQRPPRPTSSTATSTWASAKTQQAATVRRSNSVTW